MTSVRPKKFLGQHFLTDKNIAAKIVNSLSGEYKTALEVGPGMGVLSDFLFEKKELTTYLIDIDKESIEFLKRKYHHQQDNIIAGDFLEFDFGFFGSHQVAVIGNFPYNISSQILFKILDNRNTVPECVGMFQKEVAERVAAKPGNKDYGIISVLLQAFYNIEYLFTVNPGVFNPPPKVKSAVIRLQRNKTEQLGCNEKLFVEVVKAAFNQRRKTLRNALRKFITPQTSATPMLDLRAERLSVNDFVLLTSLFETTPPQHK